MLDWCVRQKRRWNHDSSRFLSPRASREGAGVYARGWSGPFRRENGTQRRQDAEAQRVEQFIPIHFLASLRLGVLALTSPLRLHSRWLDRSQYCPIFRTHPPEAGGHSRFAVERRGGPPIGECTPKARRRERDRTKSELAFCWSPLFFSSSRLRVRHLNSSRAQPPTFLTHTHAAVWACHP